MMRCMPHPLDVDGAEQIADTSERNPFELITYWPKVEVDKFQAPASHAEPHFFCGPSQSHIDRDTSPNRRNTGDAVDDEASKQANK